jgi:hypothetical protein
MYTLLTFNAAMAIYALVRLLADPRSGMPIGGQFRQYLHDWRTPGPVEADSEAGFSYKTMTRPRTGWRAWILRHRWGSIQSVETDLTWMAFIVFSVATMLTHNTAVLLPLATNIFVLGLMLYQRLKKNGMQPAFQAPAFGNWVKAQIGILLLWAAWIPSFIKQAGAVDRRFWIPEPTWDAVLQMLKFFLNASLSQPALSWVLYVLVLCLGLVHFRRRISQFLFLVALFAIPIAAELLVSIRRPIFWDRTLLWTTIPLFLVLAGGIVQLRFRFLIIGAVCILGTFNLFSTGDYFRFFRKEDWNAAARCVASSPQKGDLVLFNSNFVEIPFNYYFKPYEDYYFIQVEKRGIPLDLDDDGVLEPEMKKSDIPGLIALLRGHNRVWLVYSHDSYTDPQGLIPQTLAAEMTLIRECDFYGGQVQLYEAP